MDAFILAGGKGTRLAEITKNLIPKPMVPINGKPLIMYAIENLQKNGVNNFIISVSHLKEVIMQYLGDGSKFGVNIKYIIEDEPLGSGGALYFLKNIVSDDFVICSADTIFDVDLDRMYKYHKVNNSDVTMFIHPNTHPYDSDLIITDKSNHVIGIDKKNSVRNIYFNKVNAGFFIVNPRTLDIILQPHKMGLEHDFIDNLIHRGYNVMSYDSSEYIKDVGTMDRICGVRNDLKSGLISARNFNNKQKCIFLDRDGVINKYKGFISNPSDIEINDGVIDAIKYINKSGYLAIIVSNQPVIARGDASFEDVDNMHRKIETILGAHGAYLDDIIYCPHHPDKGFEGEVKELKVKCNCRKPNTGMIDIMCKKYNIDKNQSWIVGDTFLDVQTGVNAELKTILLNSGDQNKHKDKYNCDPDYKCDSLMDAVHVILDKKVFDNKIENFNNIDD